jgi:hypothetical protein
VRRYAELQPVFAGPFRVVGARASTDAPSSEMMMAAVVAMPAALGVCARLQVVHWNFLCLLFAHVTFLQSILGCVSSAEYFFHFDQLTAKI